MVTSDRVYATVPLAATAGQIRAISAVHWWYDHRPALSGAPGGYRTTAAYEQEQTEAFRRGYAQFKYVVAQVLQPRCLCEIGVRAGVAARAFLAAAPQAEYVGIDNEAFQRDLGIDLMGFVEDSLRHLGARFTLVKADSQSLDRLPGERVFDLVHIDGDHRYPSVYHDLSLAITADATWILVDDGRDAQVAAAAFAAMHHFNGGYEWAYFEDTLTGNFLFQRVRA